MLTSILYLQLTQSVKEAELDKKNKEVLATSLCGLGYLCDCLKQYDRAAICYKRSLSMLKKLYYDKQQNGFSNNISPFFF